MTKLVNLILIFVLLCGFNPIVSRPKTWVELNFQKFNKVDAESDVTVNSPNKITVSTMRRQALTYVNKDFGADYFYGDLEFQFEITVTDSTSDASVPASLFWALSNNSALTLNNLGVEPYFRCFADSDTNTGLTTLRDTIDNDVTVSVKYYCRVFRHNGIFTGEVYSNPGRTVLVRRTTLADKTNYRYLTVVGNRDDASGTATISFIVENMRFRFL